MIWLVSLVPVVAVMLVAIWTGSKRATFLAASIAALFWLLTGSPAYAAFHLVAAAVAALFAWKTVSFHARAPAPEIAKAAERAQLALKLDGIGDAVVTTNSVRRTPR